MYIPPQFAENRPEVLHRIMHEHPLGTLVRSEEGGLDADHIPFEFEPDTGPLGTLKAHVARNNPLWQRCPTGTPVMVIFRGAQAYISPNWYPSKHETHRQVPTWNYEVVHAHGTLSIHDDERYVRALVARLTREHDAAEPRPWKMGEAPPDYLQMMLGNIVGIEVQVTSLVGKSKLSQNRELRDRRNAADTLAERGRDGLAQAMRSTLPAEEN
jgi:transcriptional regulator